MRIALILGTTLGIVLVLREGLTPILALLALAGWSLLWLVPLHVLPLALDVLGWRTLLRAAAVPPALARPGRLFVIAAVREAVNRLLPVANVGGEIVGIRMLSGDGAEAPSVAASVVAEVPLTIISQLLFTAAGVLLLLHLTGKVDAAANTLIQRCATDAQDARGFSDFKAKVRKGFRIDCHKTPPCQRGYELDRVYSSASTKLSR